MPDWGAFEARFHYNPSSQSAPQMCVLRDESGTNNERFIRSVLLGPNETARGDAVFPCDSQGRISMEAVGTKVTSSGWSGITLNVNQNAQVTVDSGSIPLLGQAGRAFHHYTQSNGASDGRMVFRDFLNLMNGGSPINGYNQNDTIIFQYSGE